MARYFYPVYKQNDMKEKMISNKKPSKTEDVNDLKKQTVSNNSVKKGYNEKNPLQPQGAFKPDNSTTKN